MRWCLALICLWLALPGRGQDLVCPLTDDQGNCVRILACIGDNGLWFNGRAFGRGVGTLAGVVNSGAVCEGTWTSRNLLGLGQADVACDDGMRVTVYYTYQEEYTGTAIGRGRSNRGEWVKAWSGLHVLDYLERETGEVALPCGEATIPIS